NLLILLGALAGFHATLTLPGIAGVVLTIGMAVDTNILIFERIREELRSGKTVRAAIEAGFARAFRTVIDTHVTVLVSAAILYQGGLNYGIAFTGGALVQVRYDKPASVDLVRKGLDEIKLGTAVIQQFGDAQEYLIRLPQGGEKPEQLSKQVQEALAKAANAK